MPFQPLYDKYSYVIKVYLIKHWRLITCFYDNDIYLYKFIQVTCIKGCSRINNDYNYNNKL